MLRGSFFGEGNGGKWELGLAYYFGWMVLESLPIFADLTLCRSEARKNCILFRHRGYKSPVSMAHIPVPVPISNILEELRGFGQRCSFPPCAAVKSACVISKRSCSFSSLGKLYEPARCL